MRPVGWSLAFARRAQAMNLAALFGAALLALFPSGCASTGARGGGPGSLAWVEIRGRTVGEIAAAVEAAFREEGYRVRLGGRDILVFEKPSSLLSALAYGGWDREDVWLRVKVYIDPVGPETWRVGCDAYRVTDRGDPAFEEAKPLSKLHSAGFRKLLLKAKARLGA